MPAGAPGAAEEVKRPLRAAHHQQDERRGDGQQRGVPAEGRGAGAGQPRRAAEEERLVRRVRPAAEHQLPSQRAGKQLNVRLGDVLIIL